MREIIKSYELKKAVIYLSFINSKYKKYNFRYEFKKLNISG